MKTGTVIAIGAGALLIAGGVYYFRLNNTATQLVTDTGLMLHKIGLDGITFRVDALLKNPTRTALKLKQPFVKLVYKGAPVGTSEAVDKDITIPGFGQQALDPIMVNIPILGLFSLGGNLYDDLTNGREIKMDITTITTLKLLTGQKPFEFTMPITLKKANA